MNLEVDINARLLSFKNARACVVGCADAYRDPPDIIDRKTDVQVRVLRGQCALRSAWVGFFFRGTTNEQGWLRDFDPTVTRFAGGYAHRDTCDSVESILTAICMSVQSKRDAIFIGGHSKGAREAQNCAFRLNALGFNVVSVYTFGTPRGFDYCAAREYDRKLGDRTWRFIHGADIVCHVPFPPLWFHTKQCVYMPVGKMFGMFNGRSWIQNPHYSTILAHDGREIAHGLIHKEAASFADHKIDTYVSAVSALQ